MKQYTHLLDTIRPIHYDITLKFNKSDMKFTGTVVLQAEVLITSAELRLHAKDLTIQSAHVGSDAVDVSVLPDTDEIVLSGKTFTPGDTELRIEFSSDITKPMHGIYPCFFTHQGKEKTLIATQFESHHAREAFPCIDEPAAKATFALTLLTPKNEQVYSNTEIISQTETENLLQTSFEKTPIMSTYLVAFAFGELGRKSATTRGGTEVGVIATPENVSSLDFALDVAVRTLEFYNEYFDIPFPLKKVDHIALPDFAAGAMENWGLITYRESALLLDPKHGSVENKQRVAIVIAHELAHQWFGNLVTMQWWTDLWLNEGFASWMEYLAIDSLFPDWQMWTQFISDDMFRGMSLDSLASSHPVEVEIGHPDDIRGIFDAISYSKGASVIRMLHGFLGANDFQTGIRHYLNTHSYKNATTADLWDALEEKSNKPVRDFMTAWTSQTGFPVVSVEKTADTISLSQHRYLISPNASAEPTLWPVPLNDSKSSGLFSEKESKLSISEFKKININQSGFYISKYDPTLQKSLRKQAHAKSLPAEDRMGLVNDSWMLARSGDADTVDALKMLSGFSKEDNAAVWDTIAGQVGLVKRALGSDEVYEGLRPYVGRLARSTADAVGWEIRDTDSHFERLLRPTVLGMMCFSDDQAALNQSDTLFEQMTAPEDIPADLRGVVMVTAARRGDALVYEKLLKAYRSTDSAQLKAPVIAALTSFKQEDLNQKTLAMITSESVKLQEVHNWVGGIFMNRHAKSQAWEWLKENWDWFVEQFGSDIMTFAYIPKYAAASMNTKQELLAFSEYCMQAHTEGINRQIEQARETIEWQSAWRSRDHDAVAAYLNSPQD